jgi:hypothetical protein
VQSDLAEVEGISEITTDIAKQLTTFRAPPDFDVEATLNELAATNDHIKGWSRNDN